MANRPYILVYFWTLYQPTFWYRQAIYFDLKLPGSSRYICKISAFWVGVRFRW